MELFSDRKFQEEADKVESQGVVFSNKVVWENMLGAYLTTPYYYENRLYLVIHLSRDEGCDESARLMFSCLASDGSDFRFEKEVTQYLWENSITYKYVIMSTEVEDNGELDLGETVIENTGEFIYFMDGCIVMHFYNEKMEGERDEHHRLVVYDIHDGTFQEAQKYSEEYGYFKALGFSENWMIRGVDWYAANLEPLYNIQTTKKEWEERYKNEEGTYI